MVRAYSMADIVDRPAPVSPSSTSTYGFVESKNGTVEEDNENEKDSGDDFMSLEEDSNPSPSLASIQAAPKLLALQTKP